MLWTKTYYPDAMKDLLPEVRLKAIEIGNALLKENHQDEETIIAAAISRAKDWAANRGKKTGNPQVDKISDVKEYGKDTYVVPFDKQREVKKEGSKKIKKAGSKTEGVKSAKAVVKKTNGTVTIKKKTGKTEKRKSFNTNKKKVQSKNY
jgi:uncharacterized protein YdaT